MQRGYSNSLVWHNMPASIYQPDIRRLHERIHKNKFENAFVLSAGCW